MSHTLCIIKPDIYKKGLEQVVLARIIITGFKVVGLKYKMLTRTDAFNFYIEHKEKDFFNDLIEFMTSDPVVMIVLEKINAVDDFRLLIGDSDPKKADLGTIRHIYGTGLPNNAVHGSDSENSAKREIEFFFPELINKI